MHTFGVGKIFYECMTCALSTWIMQNSYASCAFISLFIANFSCKLGGYRYHLLDSIMCNNIIHSSMPHGKLSMSFQKSCDRCGDGVLLQMQFDTDSYKFNANFNETNVNLIKTKKFEIQKHENLIGKYNKWENNLQFVVCSQTRMYELLKYYIHLKDGTMTLVIWF